MDTQNRVKNIWEEAQKTQREFLQAELEIALTFTQIAKTQRSLGNLEHAEAARAKAVKAYKEIQRKRAKVKIPKAHLRSLMSGFNKLKNALKDLSPENP